MNDAHHELLPSRDQKLDLLRDQHWIFCLWDLGFRDPLEGYANFVLLVNALQLDPLPIYVALAWTRTSFPLKRATFEFLFSCLSLVSWFLKPGKLTHSIALFLLICLVHADFSVLFGSREGCEMDFFLISVKSLFSFCLLFFLCYRFALYCVLDCFAHSRT